MRRLQVHLAIAHAALRAGRWTAAQREIDEAMTSLDDSLTPHRRSLLAWTAALVHRHEQTLTGHSDRALREPGRSPTLGRAALAARRRRDRRCHSRASRP